MLTHPFYNKSSSFLVDTPLVKALARCVFVLILWILVIIFRSNISLSIAVSILNLFSLILLHRTMIYYWCIFRMVTILFHWIISQILYPICKFHHRQHHLVQKVSAAKVLLTAHLIPFDCQFKGLLGLLLKFLVQLIKGKISLYHTPYTDHELNDIHIFSIAKHCWLLRVWVA